MQLIFSTCVPNREREIVIYYPVDTYAHIQACLAAYRVSLHVFALPSSVCFTMRISLSSYWAFFCHWGGWNLMKEANSIHCNVKLECFSDLTKEIGYTITMPARCKVLCGRCLRNFAGWCISFAMRLKEKRLHTLCSKLVRITAACI